MARKGTRAGYTLIELMVVVAVIGVLAAIAIPTFQAYLQRARASEAPTFLGEIRQRQESYRAEFGQYCNASSASASAAISAGAWNPATLPTGGDRGSFDPALNRWDHLGAAPDGPTYFQYRTTAGPPGAASGVGEDAPTDFWFVAQARGDLDADGETVTFEAYSGTSRIFIGDDSMSPLGAGWE